MYLYILYYHVVDYSFSEQTQETSRCDSVFLRCLLLQQKKPLEFYELISNCCVIIMKEIVSEVKIQRVRLVLNSKC